MCKDLEHIFHTEKDPSQAELDQLLHKWIIPNQEVEEEMIVEFTSKTIDYQEQKKKACLTHFNKRNSIDPTDKRSLLQPLETGKSTSVSRKSFNPIKAFGHKVNNIFTWFKKKEKLSIEQDEVSSHRSADIDD